MADLKEIMLQTKENFIANLAIHNRYFRQPRAETVNRLFTIPSLG